MRGRTIPGDVTILVGAIVFLTVAGISAFFILYLNETMGASLERYASLTADEMARTLEDPLYTISDDVARNIAEAYLSTGKLRGLRVASMATGIIIDKPAIGAPVSRPISREGMDLGKVEIWFDHSEIARMRNRLLFLASAFLVGILATCGLSLNLILKRILIRPFRVIMKGIDAISAGDYSHRIPKPRHEELALLVDTLNRMSESILTKNRLISEGERRYAAIFDTNLLAIFIHDEKGRIIDVNASMLRMYGLASKEEALSYDILKDYSGPDCDLTQLKSFWREVKAGGERFFPWTARRPVDGSTFPVEVTLRRVVLPGGDFIIANVLDITERRKIEEQLMQAQKMEAVGTIAGGLAHDFNNILSGITGSISLMQLKASKCQTIQKDDFLKHLDDVNEAAFRAAGVVKKLLTLSRRQESHMKPLDIVDTVRHVVAIAESSIDRSVELDIRYLDHPALVRGDATQLEQVLLNLVVNAGHAMTVMRPEGEPWGGRLTVSFGECFPDAAFRRIHPQAGGMLYRTISLADTGVGISASDLKKIFLPFYTTKADGTGLGLSMVYGIVKDHGGFLTVYSEPGMGTVFNIYLPALDEAVDKPTEESPRSAFRGSGLVLVIDDEELFRTALRDILIELGYEVIVASNGMDGERLHAEQRDKMRFTMLDMVMPKQSGKETFERIRASDPDARIIIMSGFLQDPRIQALMDRGVSAFLQKPFDMGSLIEVLRGMGEDRG